MRRRALLATGILCVLVSWVLVLAWTVLTAPDGWSVVGRVIVAGLAPVAIVSFAAWSLEE